MQGLTNFDYFHDHADWLLHFWGNGVMEGSCAHGKYKAAVRLVRKRSAH